MKKVSATEKDSATEKVYEYYMPPVTLMGVRAVERIGEQIKELKGSKALIVTDKKLIKIGIVNQVVDYIKAANIETEIFDGVKPNPTVENVEDGLDILEIKECDILVSIGGGSAHDCAKAISLVATNGGIINHYEGTNQATEPTMPLVSVNTTAGTASEMTHFCIITDEERYVKMSIVDWKLTPNVAINDPLLMMKKPPALTAETGMDALTHAIEAYMSTSASPLTDAAALMSIKLISQNLRQAVANGERLEARDKMAYAQFLAGMAFNNASLGLVHAMSHQLGGFYDLTHGVCNAILLPHVERFNLIADPQRLANIAEAMGENITGLSVREAANKAIDAIITLSTDIDIPQRLRDLKTEVRPEDFELLAENALKDTTSLTNPRKATEEEVVAIFDAAY
ncbi:iron-containing alcohol dehydrogenase [Selenihalanaerobacter shriftii]|uniref:Alcohol dehydrogenase n=1 Tax=Selenihalanaerobacter shriftii TaxID=142842 RepID=A0A1T4JU15_9FIRM|nr:iron-containing alcohol dehydrogenase [Selenihalanaerobacter shriftii]SJZ33656.1 alcohol dehydrogenase [Selenihalanaerobacter shriftii]